MSEDILPGDFDDGGAPAATSGGNPNVPPFEGVPTGDTENPEQPAAAATPAADGGSELPLDGDGDGSLSTQVPDPAEEAAKPDAAAGKEEAAKPDAAAGAEEAAKPAASADLPDPTADAPPSYDIAEIKQFFDKAETAATEYNKLCDLMDPTKTEDPKSVQEILVPLLGNLTNFLENSLKREVRIVANAASIHHVGNYKVSAERALEDMTFYQANPKFAENAEMSPEKAMFLGYMNNASIDYAGKHNGVNLMGQPKAKKQAMEWAAEQVNAVFSKGKAAKATQTNGSAPANLPPPAATPATNTPTPNPHTTPPAPMTSVGTPPAPAEASSVVEIDLGKGIDELSKIYGT